MRATAEPPESWLERSQLTGDWGGARTRLIERGVDPWATYTSGVWSNLRGGFDTGARYLGLARWGVDVDLDRVARLPGTSFHISWHAYHGGQPSEDLVGQFLTNALSGDEADDSVRFYDLYLQQPLFDARLVVKAGYMTVEQDFFAADHAAALRNASFGDFGSGRAQEVAPFYPVAAPGLVITAKPSEAWVFRSGVYAADPGQDESGNIGFDGSFGDGVTFFTELGIAREPFGGPGSYSLGSIVTTASVRNFDDGKMDKGAHGIYALVDQALVVDADHETRLAAFFRGAFNFEQEQTVIRGALAAGLVAYGPLPGRERDVFAVGYSYTRFGRDYRSSVRASGEHATRQESLLELSYRAQLTGWLTLQPDLQLIFDPHSTGNDAIAAGLTAVIEF